MTNFKSIHIIEYVTLKFMYTLYTAFIRLNTPLNIYHFIKEKP